MSPLRYCALFLLAALVGPALALLGWLCSSLLGPAGVLSTIGAFLSDLVLLLWPFQVLGVAEASLGSTLAISVAVAANLMLFAVLGVGAWSIAKKPAMMLVLYFLVIATVFWGSLWGAGYQLRFVSWSGFTAAALFYAGLFAVASRKRSPRARLGSQ
jgi:hypothetical protein